MGEMAMLDFITGLLMIVMIDLVLAGDNAVVIGMAARNVPADSQKKVIILGTAGAILIRILATLVVVKLLEIPGLHLAGGLLLIWIAFKLLVSDDGHGANIKAQSSMWKAIGTIIVADMAMGIDNVVAIAGASHGSFVLVVLGLLISVPIMVFGSTLVIKLMDRYPAVIYIGAGILAWTAGKMILGEGFIQPIIEPLSYGKYIIVALVVAIILYAGKLKKSKQQHAESGV
jgi:YjbE family integral membrane protein